MRRRALRSFGCGYIATLSSAFFVAFLTNQHSQCNFLASVIGQVYSMAIPLFVDRWNPLSLSRVFERVCKAVSLFEDASATLRSSSGRQICEFYFF